MLPGFGAAYIAQHDCATRRGNNFRRRNTLSLRTTNWRKLVHQSSEKNIFERNRKNRTLYKLGALKNVLKRQAAHCCAI
jgi:hypothetical protein